MTSAIWMAVVLALAVPEAWTQEIVNIYATNCANCHGSDGGGNTPLGRALKLPDLRSPAVQRLSEAQLAAVLSKGAGGGKMPGFEKKLGAEAVRQLAEYVHGDFESPSASQMTRTARPEPAPDPTNVKNIYATKCAHCHGADGSGDTVLGRELKLRDIRSADAQQFSDSELTTIIASGTDHGRMPGFQKKLGQDMVMQLASYVRVLAGRPPIAKAENPEEVGESTTATPPATSGSRESGRDVEDQGKEPTSEVTKILKPSGVSPADAGKQALPTKLVDLNSATKELLMSLPGITESDAVNIINGRPYKSTMQFKIRRIITPEIYAQIAGRVMAKRPPKAKAPPSN